MSSLWLDLDGAILYTHRGLSTSLKINPKIRVLDTNIALIYDAARQSALCLRCARPQFLGHALAPMALDLEPVTV